MLKKILLNTLILVIAIPALLFLLSLKQGGMVHSRIHPPPEEKNHNPTRIGEKIIYEVYLGWIHLGRSTFTHLPNTKIDNNKEVALMTFETEIKGFYDLEKIYSDKTSLLPVRVRRDIKGWGYDEQIIEDYNPQDLTITFTKFTGGKKEVKVVKADGPLNNAVLMPFYLRRIPAPAVGWSMTVCIPQKFEIRLVAIEEVQVPAGKFSAYFFKSKPDNFEIWVSADERKIPLKIKSSGSTMVMSEYNFTE